MTTTRIRKGEHTVNFKGNNYYMEFDSWNTYPVWHVFSNGEFLFMTKSKKRALEEISRID